MFPLADERGRVLGFGAGRWGRGQQPKYLNTADGEVFHRAGSSMAPTSRGRLRPGGPRVLVEGYTDVIALRQAGVPRPSARWGRR